ncbi:MAG: hypothetical protein DRI98_14860 [Bacteroidetes bacterium]|nr:MAG: hypothetical protein DRI98_14860 [Bacteroidota bacterium]
MMKRGKINREINQQSFRDKISFTKTMQIIEKIEDEMQELLKPVEVIVDGKMTTEPAPPIDTTHLAARKLLMDSQYKKVDKLVANAPAISAKDFLDWQNGHLLAGDELAPTMDLVELKKRIRFAVDQEEDDTGAPEPIGEPPSFL